MALWPVVRGLIFAILGWAFGALLVFAIRALTGLPIWEVEQVIAVGYPFALIGWLMGVGLWEVWGREWFGLPTVDDGPRDWRRYFRYNLDHKVIGVQYIVTFVFLFLFAGLLAMLMRLELSAPGRTIMGPNEFNTVMSLHGIIMVAVAVATVIGGFGNYVLPLMIGAEDVAFPRVNALSYWVIPPVVLLLLGGLLFGGFDTGWTAYPPLSAVNASGQLLFLLAFFTFGLSSILGALNFLATVVTLRAPGLTWSRLPIFVWSIIAAALISLTATQFVAGALLLVVLDRVAGTSFFVADGGAPLLYQHLFWFYSHPAVYIMILPAFGLILEILTHFSRKPLFGYRWVVRSFLGVVGLSFVVWAHHLFTSGMEDFLHIPFMVTTELISIPTGMVFLAALGTIWYGRLWLRTPMLFALGFVFNFAIGGVTGIFLADVPVDIQLQDTYFVVAHFHYTIVGGEIFAILAGLYYWFPKITGRMYSERLGKLHFWWVFVMYNVTFIPMFQVGLDGMNRRIADYLPRLAGLNLFISIAAFVLGASFLVMVYNLVTAWIHGPRAAANPWQARTLEWQTSSPPPLHNFETPPVVEDYPYSYGEPSHRDVGLAPRPIAGGAPRGGE